MARSRPDRENLGWEALIYVDDLEKVYRGVLSNNWSVVSEPEAQPWGGRTFKVVDLNGFRLTFAQMMESPSMEEIQRRINEEPQ